MSNAGARSALSPARWQAGTVHRGPTLVLSLPRILAFSAGLFGESGWPHRNLHTDAAKAEDAGLPAIIASGTQFEGHLVEYLVDLFGVDWLRHGELNVRIPRSIYVDDTVTPVVRVVDVITADGSSVVNLALTVENQRGEAVLDGTGAFRLPERRS